jgi:hypothetical protein
MKHARSFDREELLIGSACDVVKGKYQGYRGTIERLTAWKVVVYLEDWNGRSVMICRLVCGRVKWVWS